jgi:hypothetical protein
VEVSAVSGKRLRKWMGLGLALAMSGFPAKAKVAARSPVIVTISVHNDVAVPWGTIREAEGEASRVFREAGIDVEWMNCQAVSGETLETEKSRSCREAIFPEHLQLRIVKQSVGLRPDVMGVSFLSEDGSGCQADLFYEGVEGLRQKTNASLAIILGDVASHEIGHLLLGTNSHAPHGVMRAVWGQDELVSVARRTLFFSEKESARMRGRLGSAEPHGGRAAGFRRTLGGLKFRPKD